jgi:hypothetical protein
MWRSSSNGLLIVGSRGWNFRLLNQFSDERGIGYDYERAQETKDIRGIFAFANALSDARQQFSDCVWNLFGWVHRGVRGLPQFQNRRNLGVWSAGLVELPFQFRVNLAIRWGGLHDPTITPPPISRQLWLGAIEPTEFGLFAWADSPSAGQGWEGLQHQHWAEMPKVGHVAGMEEPAPLADDIRTFFREMRCRLATGSSGWWWFAT